mgnify:FL=1
MGSLFSYAFDGILSFSTAPLKISGILGIFLLLLSCFLGASAFIQQVFFHQSISSLYLVIGIVVFLSSLQMLMVFILGEYLSKDYLENKKRPLYIIREQN